MTKVEETKAIASEQLLMEQLANRDWERLWLRLIGRCAWLLRVRYNVKWPNNQLQEFSRNSVSETVSKIYVEKQRKWNVDAYPDFEHFIVSALDSHVNNTLNTTYKKKLEEEFNEQTTYIDEGTEHSIANVIATRELRQQIVDELKSAGADDDELLVFECLADGMEKPEDIKADLGLSDADFHNIWRRLKRKRDIVRQKLATNEC